MQDLSFNLMFAGERTLSSRPPGFAFSLSSTWLPCCIMLHDIECFHVSQSL